MGLYLRYEHDLSIVKYERQYRALIAKLSGEMDAYFNSSQLDSLFVNNHDDSHPPTLVHHNAGDEQLGNGLGEVPATRWDIQHSTSNCVFLQFLLELLRPQRTPA